MLVNRNRFDIDKLPKQSEPWIDRARRSIIPLQEGQIKREVIAGHATPILVPEVFAQIIDNLKGVFFAGL